MYSRAYIPAGSSIEGRCQQILEESNGSSLTVPISKKLTVKVTIPPLEQFMEYFVKGYMQHTFGLWLFRPNVRFVQVIGATFFRLLDAFV